MNEIPNPLTPADCDLRDFPYMPLDVQRLCDSDLAALESPEACWAALLLWCKAWHQVPAGSLPDDDRVLAKFTGYQRAPDAWLSIREGALRGWIKCADGRLYHPVVAEKANEGWFAKHRQAHDKLCERMRKRNKARVDSGLVPLEVPELEQWIDMGRPLEKSLFPQEFRSASGGKKKTSVGGGEDFRRNNAEIPAENALKGKEGKGEGELTDKTSGSVVAGGNSPRGGRDDFTPKNEGEWQRYFRERHGVELDATSVHDRKKAWPLFSAWCKRGVTTAQMDRAVAKAQDEATETIAFLPSYVDRVLATLSRPTPEPRLTPAEQRRAISKANGDAWLAEDPQADPNVIDMEH